MASSSSQQGNEPSSLLSKIFLRDFINGQLSSAEPWKVVLGTAAVAATAAWYLSDRQSGSQDSLFRRFAGAALSSARQLPGVSGIVSAQTSKVMQDMKASLTSPDCGDPSLALPATGLTHDEILRILTTNITREAEKWRAGKVSGVVYLGQDDHTRLVNEAFTLYSLSNPLHADLFPSLRKFESEVIAMTISMLGGRPAPPVSVPGESYHYGAVTSGGTESILMALKCYRDWARETRPDIVLPEVICCETAHAAFEKGAAYFGLRLVHVPVGADHRMDIEATRRAIGRNTVLLVGSAPCYSSGMIDPIAELGQLALQHRLGLHVDGCLGGFIMPWIKQLRPDVPPFDFSVPGVTSMSADTHKYGYAVKGTSVLMFSSKQLRDYMYFVSTEWPGGVYASPGLAGSRSGGLVAATWASLMAMGTSGYMAIAEGIVEFHRQIVEGIPRIAPLQLLGESKSSVVAFRSDKLDIFRVGEGMHKRGWSLNSLQRPNAIHVCIVAPMIGKADVFLTDLSEIVAEILSSPTAYTGGSAGVYGLATSIPDRSLIREITTGYLDILSTPMAAPVASSSSSSSS